MLSFGNAVNGKEHYIPGQEHEIHKKSRNLRPDLTPPSYIADSSDRGSENSEDAGVDRRYSDAVEVNVENFDTVGVESLLPAYRLSLILPKS